MINKVIKKFLLIVLLFLFCIALPTFTITVNASSQLYDEKIYFEFDNNIEFENDSIIVIMDKLLSGKNKVHSLDFFGIDLFEEITDLTYGDINILNDDFEQILELKLRKKNREGVLEAIDILQNIQGIKYVGPNTIYSFDQSANDPYYVSDDLWGIYEIDLPDAWDYSTGSSEIRIGVIDSGVASHPDLNANVITGFDFFSDNTITNDDIRGHGTQVAGIIGATGNNDRGVTGVNWDTTIVPLQVSSAIGNVNASACVEAVNYATESYNTENPIRILNFSIGSSFEWHEMETAIRQYPGLFVCAAGNDGKDTTQDHYYPGFYGTNLHDSPLNNILVVGAIDEYDERSIWTVEKSSNYGTNTVDIYAPGSNIVSTYPEAYYTPGGMGHIAEGYYSNAGTSFAAPYVAGVASLLLSMNKNLTVSQLKNAILNNAGNINITIPDGSTQNVKKLNAYNAVKYVLSNYSETMTLGTTAQSLSQYVDSSSTFFDEKNYFAKLDVDDSLKCNFTVSSTSPLEITLYDSSFNEMDLVVTQTNGGATNSFIKYLTEGSYYLKANFTGENTSGTITTTIVGEHFHSPSSWTYYNNSLHRGMCSCGEWIQKAHVINASQVVNFRTICLECHALLDLRDDSFIGQMGIRKESANGSYVLPNGVIVLVEEDVDAYFAGTLIFYDGDSDLLTQ